MPPAIASVKVAAEPTQVNDVPFIGFSDGVGLIVTIAVTVVAPQLFVTVYEMVAVPPATPETIPVPDPTVATDVFPEFHTPAAVASLKFVVAPLHAVNVPVIPETVGFKGVTVTEIFPQLPGVVRQPPSPRA